MNVCTTGNLRVPYPSCTHTAVYTGNVMFLFMALHQVVLRSLFSVQQTTSGIGHRVKLQYAECEKQQQQQQQTDVPQKMLRIFHGAQGVLLYHRKQTQNSTNQRAHRVLWSVMSQPTSRLPLLLSATRGTAYDALIVSPLFSGATQILKS